MKDYYEELGLRKSDSLNAIKNELLKLERAWIQRQSKQPEKAIEHLALINEAKKVFNDEGSKSEYDRELSDSHNSYKETKHEESKNSEFEKWYKRAGEYLNRHEDDLAKMAVEKAIMCMKSEDESDYFFGFAAIVYATNNEFDQALDYVNRAIIINDDKPMHHLLKARILRSKGLKINQFDRKTGTELIVKARNIFDDVSKSFEKKGDIKNQAKSLGYLASSYYYDPMSNESYAENFANSAISLDPNEENARNVLNEIREKRHKIDLERARQSAAEEERKREQEEQERKNEHRRLEQERRDSNKKAFYLIVSIVLAIPIIIIIMNQSIAIEFYMKQSDMFKYLVIPVVAGLFAVFEVIMLKFDELGSYFFAVSILSSAIACYLIGSSVYAAPNPGIRLLYIVAAFVSGIIIGISTFNPIAGIVGFVSALCGWFISGVIVEKADLSKTDQFMRYLIIAWKIGLGICVIGVIVSILTHHRKTGIREY